MMPYSITNDSHHVMTYQFSMDFSSIILSISLYSRRHFSPQLLPPRAIAKQEPRPRQSRDPAMLYLLTCLRHHYRTFKLYFSRFGKNKLPRRRRSCATFHRSRDALHHSWAFLQTLRHVSYQPFIVSFLYLKRFVRASLSYKNPVFTRLNVYHSLSLPLLSSPSQ
jgi:hypothetical protein